MADHQKTKRERAEENTALKRRIQKLEAAEAEREQAEELIRPLTCGISMFLPVRH